MDAITTAFLEYEARALLARLARMKPFALHEAMAPAAAFTPAAATAIDAYLSEERRRVRAQAREFLDWLHSHAGRSARPAEGQRRFILLRLSFGRTLTQFDLFVDALTQRSERDTGVWLAGLDVAASDALALPGYYQTPSAICYLDRGVGAAIRRARTRLPGGGENPVALIRVPRERMIGSGIASSLVHEVGHQAAALLELVASLRAQTQQRWRAEADPSVSVWRFWERWISEVIADFWSVARLGFCSTAGLIGVVSLPKPFVFRVGLDDPHPFPWIRVRLSAAIGNTLFPHPQWEQLINLWNAFYPTSELRPATQQLLAELIASMPEFLQMLTEHRSAALRGRTLREVMTIDDRQPHRLAAHYRTWLAQPERMYATRPTLVFATLGQARADGRLSAEGESAMLAKLLTHWALRSNFTSLTRCARDGASTAVT